MQEACSNRLLKHVAHGSTGLTMRPASSLSLSKDEAKVSSFSAACQVARFCRAVTAKLALARAAHQTVLLAQR